MPENGRRSLAAIMFTDVVGYSSLAQRNESLALELLEEHRRILRPLLVKNNGKEIKTIGDAFLVEFPSAFEALQCAIQIQHALNNFNSSRPSESKIWLRVGIHLGDIIRNDSDILGDAVNIASRIEPLAEPGGICISEQVHDQVRNKFQSPMIRLEDVQLKNINAPIGVYRIVMSEGDPGVTKSILPSTRIAILPFVNISPDPNDEYFSDGLTEELIAKVSLTKSLKVIARTSVMNYKGKEKSVMQIGKELNAGYIVEGSVRKSGNKIRVTVQLIDANNEEHLWAENYDKNLDDIFEIQSEISAKVAESLVSNLRPRSLAEPTEIRDVTTYAVYMRANQLRHLDQDRPVREALKLLDGVVVESPNFARAYVAIAGCWLSLANIGTEPFNESAQQAKAAVTRALDLDPKLAEAYVTLAAVLWALDDPDESMHSVLTKAIDLNENQDEAYLFLSGYYLARSNLPSAAKSMEKAYELNPLSRRVAGYLGAIYFYLGKDGDALSVWRRVLQMFPSRLTAYELLVEYYLSKGDYNEAIRKLNEGLQAVDDDQGKAVLNGYIYAITKDRSNVENIAERLEKGMKSGTVMLNHIGYMYYILKDIDKFFDYMTRSAEAHSLGAFQLKYSPFFAPIRSDPRYFELMKKVNFEP